MYKLLTLICVFVNGFFGDRMIAIQISVDLLVLLSMFPFCTSLNFK